MTPEQPKIEWWNDPKYRDTEWCPACDGCSWQQYDPVAIIFEANARRDKEWIGVLIDMGEAFEQDAWVASWYEKFKDFAIANKPK